jgi:hypothetical protein
LGDFSQTHLVTLPPATKLVNLFANPSFLWKRMRQDVATGIRHLNMNKRT